MKCSQIPTDVAKSLSVTDPLAQLLSPTSPVQITVLAVNRGERASGVDECCQIIERSSSWLNTDRPFWNDILKVS